MRQVNISRFHREDHGWRGDTRPRYVFEYLEPPEPEPESEEEKETSGVGEFLRGLFE